MSKEETVYDILAQKHKLTPEQRNKLEQDVKEVQKDALAEWERAGAPQNGYINIHAGEAFEDGGATRYFSVHLEIHPNARITEIKAFTELSSDEFLDDMNKSAEELTPEEGWKKL